MVIRNFKIGTRLAVGFGLILMLLAMVVIVSSVISNLNAKSLANELGTINTKSQHANAMKSAMLEEAIAMRNIGLQTEVGEMQKQEKKVYEAKKRYEQAKQQLQAMGLSDIEQKSLADIDRYGKEIQPWFLQVLGLVTSFSTDNAAKILANTIDPLQQKSIAAIDVAVEQQRQTATRALSNQIGAARNLTIMQSVLGVVAIVIGIICAVLLTRSITTPLKNAVEVAQRVAEGNLSSSVVSVGKDEIAELLEALRMMNWSLNKIVKDVRESTSTIRDASEQIASGNMDLSSRTEQQAASLQQTAAAMKQLTSTVKMNADNAEQANSMANTASTVASKANQAFQHVVSTMTSITDSSKKIADIISVIDGIAFQTNILALNAAVEAARAGEQGRGFAVVASEVRSLAQRSALAAKEIKGLIVDSNRNVTSGSKFVSEAGVTIQEIMHSVESVTSFMTDISSASHEQSRGIEQINGAVDLMDQSTQENAALVEQAASAAEAMLGQANRLAQTVSVFKLSTNEKSVPLLLG